MAVVHEIINLVECQKIHGCGCIADNPPHGKSALMGMLLLKDMTSFRTDFETHAMWQGYVENPTAKDFVARKARTIVLSKSRGSCHKTSNNQPYS
jgi:hypothetical protein